MEMGPYWDVLGLTPPPPPSRTTYPLRFRFYLLENSNDVTAFDIKAGMNISANIWPMNRPQRSKSDRLRASTQFHERLRRKEEVEELL